MPIYHYHTPTQIVFGKGAENLTAQLLHKYNAHKILLHYGGRSAEDSGLLPRLRKILHAENIPFVELGGVKPNPRLSLIREGIKLCRQEGVDFILAVGGGSVVDSAKAIGYGLASGGDVWDFFDRKRKAIGCTPLGVVLTMAAAGSEMSASCVITSEEGWLKRGYTTDMCRPRFAIMDPELTMTLPPFQTACGCADILMHTMERYFFREGGLQLTDGIAEALLRTVMKNALILQNEPCNYQARAEMMWASSLSHNGLTGFGADGGDWAPHKIEHELSGMYDVAHGAGLSAIWASWARYVYKALPHRFCAFAEHVMDIPREEDQEHMALKGIEAMENFFRRLGLPVSITELGISPTEEEMNEMALKCREGMGKPVGVAMPLESDDIAAILRMAR